MSQKCRKRDWHEKGRTMSTVADLQPGDLVYVAGMKTHGIFIARAPHPEYPGLELVIWKLSDGSMSFDALRMEQDIGWIQASTGQSRGARLYGVMKESEEKIVGYLIEGHPWPYAPEDVTIIREGSQPIEITRNDLLSEWRKANPDTCSCPVGEIDLSCPLHGNDVLKRYITRRREGLNLATDPYERGKEMAYLSILQFLADSE
jgi:hypothetical protein